MVVVDLDDRILIRGILIELAKGDRLTIVLGIEDNRASTQSDYGSCPAAARMPNGTVGAAEMVGIIAGNRPFLDKQFPHRHHFPFDFLTLRAQIIVLAGCWIRINF